MVALLILMILALAVGLENLGGSATWALFVAGLLVGAGTYAGWRTFRGVTGGRRLSDGL